MVTNILFVFTTTKTLINVDKIEDLFMDMKGTVMIMDTGMIMDTSKIMGMNIIAT